MNADYQTTRAPQRGARHPRELITPADRMPGVCGDVESAGSWKPSLAHMSHELRTPIHAVLGYAALLSDGAGGALPRTAAEMVVRISRSAQRLRELVDDILELGRLDAGAMPLALEDVALEPLLRDVMLSLEPRARAKRLALHLRADRAPRVRSDRGRVSQIALNLVSNAVEYTERGSVMIELEQRAGGIAIHVVDTGPGIARADHDRVFEDFVRLGSDPGGTGLGLAISRRLARLLGGTLTLRSEPGLGSCFTLTLPIAGPELPGCGTSSSLSAFSPRVKVTHGSGEARLDDL